MRQQTANEFDLKFLRGGSAKEPHARLRIWVDGSEVDQGAIDGVALLNASLTPGRHYPFTCICGFSGCAGIEDGVEAEIKGSWVQWTLRLPQSNRGFDSYEDWQRLVKPTVWIFDQRQMLEEIRQELVYADVTHPWKTEYAGFGLNRRYIIRMIERIDYRLPRIKKAHWQPEMTEQLYST